MIISKIPKSTHAWRGLYVPIVALVLWDVLVTIFYFNESTHFEGVDIQFTLFGTAIALFVGFMVNASYARWWEARTLWGQIVNSSRSLGRQVSALIDHDPAEPDGGTASQIVRNQIAYVHVLRTELRGQSLPEEAERSLTEASLATIKATANKANAILLDTARLVTRAQRRGLIGDFTRVALEPTFTALSDAQGGLERIKNTPLPVQYRFLPRFFSRVFCVILPFAVVEDLGWATPVGSGLVSLMFVVAVQIGDQLASPFADSVFDIPMTAITRTIEIDLSQMIGDRAPQPVQPVAEVLY